MANYTVTDLSSVDDTPLEESDTHDILVALHPVVAEWRAIGCALRIPPGVLASISKNRNDNPRDCLRDVVDEWLKHNYMDTKKYGEPTWRWLVEVVACPMGGANKKLAKKIAMEHEKEFTPASNPTADEGNAAGKCQPSDETNSLIPTSPPQPKSALQSDSTLSISPPTRTAPNVQGNSMPVIQSRRLFQSLSQDAVPQSYYDILLLGKTGKGNSTTGNKLLGLLEAGMNPHCKTWRMPTYGYASGTELEPLDLDDDDQPFFQQGNEKAIQSVTMRCKLLSNGQETRVLDTPGFSNTDMAARLGVDLCQANLQTMRWIVHRQQQHKLAFSRVVYFLPGRGPLEKADCPLQEEIKIMVHFFGDTIFHRMVIVATWNPRQSKRGWPFEEEDIQQTKMVFKEVMKSVLKEEGFDIDDTDPECQLQCPPVVYISLNDTPEQVLSKIKDARVQGTTMPAIILWRKQELSLTPACKPQPEPRFKYQPLPALLPQASQGAATTNGRSDICVKRPKKSIQPRQGLPLREEIPYYDVLLLGNMGKGKSTTGNKLLGLMGAGVARHPQDLMIQAWNLPTLTGTSGTETEPSDLDYDKQPFFWQGDVKEVQSVTKRCKLLSNEHKTKVRVLDTPPLLINETKAGALVKPRFSEIANLQLMLYRMMHHQQEYKLAFNRVLYFLPGRGPLEKADYTLQEEIKILVHHFGDSIFYNMVLIATWHPRQSKSGMSFDREDIEQTQTVFKRAMKFVLEEEGFDLTDPECQLQCPPVVYISLNDTPEQLLCKIKGAKVQGTTMPIIRPRRELLAATYSQSQHSAVCAKCAATIVTFENGVSVIRCDDGTQVPYEQSKCHPAMIPKHSTAQKLRRLVPFGRRSRPAEICPNCGGPPDSVGCIPIQCEVTLKDKKFWVDHKYTLEVTHDDTV